MSLLDCDSSRADYFIATEQQKKKARTRRNYYELFAVLLKGYRGRVDGRAQLHVPDISSRLRVEDDEVPIGITGKNYAPEVERAPPLGALKYGKDHFSVPVRASIALRAPEGRSTGSGT